ncbi:AarF/ABC1/UbiB kinase family protein, partial [Halioglobus sp.]|nr:AarF/ABC1/UbiB kinase family protein [Halioglobus sp.]
MAKKPPKLKGNILPRSLSISLASARAGGALAADSLIQRVMGRDSEDTHSRFARREAEKFVQELGRLKGSYIKIGQML